MAPCPGNECGVRNTQCAMRNTELHRAAWNRRLVMLEHPPPAHVIIGPVCIAQSPLSANTIPHSALRIPHSLIVRSTANHPFAPRGKPRGGGLSWERMRSAEYAMRNAEYRTAQGSVESPACHVGPSARAHNYRSCRNHLVASICKHYSAFRTPHSAFPNRSIHGQPSGYSERGAARWRPCPGNECGVRNTQCAMRNTELHRAAWNRRLVMLEHPPPAHVIIGPVCIAQSPLSANTIPHSALRIPHSLIVRSTANHPFAPRGKPRGGGLSWERMRECGIPNCTGQRGIAGLSCWTIRPRT